MSGRARPDVSALPIEEMRQWYADGESVATIGRRLGLHQSKVRRVLIGAGVTLRSRAEQVALKDELAGVRVPSDAVLAELYVDEGLTMDEIADRFGLTAARVLLLLRRAGIARRRAGVRPERVEVERAERQPPELVAEIVGLHKSGMSRNAIARQVEMNPQVVGGIIRRAGFELHDRRKLPPIEEWVHRYVDGGETAAEIGATYSVAGNSVIRALKLAGIDRHPAMVRQSPLDEATVLSCYVDEELSIQASADRFGVSVPRVRALLDRHGVIRQGFDSSTIDRDRFERRYDDGVELADLAAEFGITNHHVRLAIREFGLPARQRSARLEISDDELVALVDAEHSDEQIATRYGVAVWQVVRRRREAGIRRPIHPLRVPISRARLERLLEAGMTRAEIATRHHVALSTVTNWCTHYGLDVVKHRPGTTAAVELDPKELRRLYVKERWTVAQIAAERGVDPALIAFALHTHRVPVRRTGEREPVVLLDALYGDPDVAAALQRHGVPLRPRAGTLTQRFRHPAPLGEELVIDLYAGLGLAATHISLLTGHRRGDVLDALRRSGTPARSASRSPWFERTILD